MRTKRPVLLCDGDDGMCGAWEVDYYEETATKVNGVRMTTEQRAPGWVSGRDSDLCPECAVAAKDGA